MINSDTYDRHIFGGVGTVVLVFVRAQEKTSQKVSENFSQ